MNEAGVGPAPKRLTPSQWLICVIAAIGFAFDTYELLLLPLIVRPALLELGGIRPGTPEFTLWFGLLFYVPAVCGGVFGVLGGYLTDRLGRKRMLSASILLYAVSSFAAGFSTSLPMLLVLRCLVFIGVCIEFVAAVAWLAELFPHDRQREWVLGATQAFSSVGGLLAALANGIIVSWAVRQPASLLPGVQLSAIQLPAIQLPPALEFLGTIAQPHADWRYTLMSGLIPAIPLLAVRPLLPESPPWLRKRREGALRRPRIAELFQPGLRRTTIITTLMFTCSFAAAFGAIQQMPQIVPGLPEVRAEVAQALSASAREGGSEAVNAPGGGDAGQRRVAASIEQAHASRLTKLQEIGGLLGRIALAGLALRVASRRRLLRLFLLPGVLLVPATFGWAGVSSLSWLECGMFVAGFLTVGQFSFWGNYLPRAYPLHLRGTGESFAANVGGRMLGASFAALTQWLAYWLPIPAAHPARVAYAAGGVALAVYLGNLVASRWLPEPRPGGLTE